MTDETTNPWGILGNPTKEEIQKWCDMPAGEFTEHVKQTKKRLREGSKSKLFTYNVKITKIISSYYRLDVKDAIVAKIGNKQRNYSDGNITQIKVIMFSRKNPNIRIWKAFLSMHINY